MPTLKQLTCSVEVEGTEAPLQEYQTVYSDGYVETYIVVPETPRPFAVHLQSDGYIAPGLSMFVYMDGVYQCNRNRQNLKIPDEDIPKKQAEIDFRVRQKEQMLYDGSFAGRSWNFNRMNVVSNKSSNANNRAPYDGEYVGTMEIVVLRCCPSIPSLDSSSTLVNPDSPIPSDEESRTPKVLAVANANEAKEQADAKPKHKHNIKSSLKTRSRPLGLDGAWDELDPPSSPTKPSEEAQPHSWGEWPKPSSTTSDQNDKARSKWGSPPPINRQAKMGTVEMRDANSGVYRPVNVGTKPASQSGSQAGSHRGSQSGLANKGSLEMLGAGGSYHQSVFGSSKAASQVGSQFGSQKDSRSGRPERTPSMTGQQTPASVHLRGGGPSSHSERSRHSSGRGSPVVVNNSIIYNGVGTPPPRSHGPPPIRRSWKNAAAAIEDPVHTFKSASKRGSVIDPWDHLPVYDPAKDPTANVKPSPKEKVASWNSGGSDMPGGWATSNDHKKSDDGWGVSSNKSQANESTWPKVVETATSENKDQEDKTSSNASKASNWNYSKNDADDGKANYSSSTHTASEAGDVLGANEYNHIEQADGWGNFNENDKKEEDNWGTAKEESNQENASWKDDAASNPAAATKKSKPASTKASKGGYGSQAGPSKPKANPGKSQPGNSFFGWLNPSNKKAPQTPASPVPSKKAPAPGSWSPPLRSRKGSSPRTAKPIATQIRVQTQARPSFSLATGPKAKPYWSNWRDPEAYLAPPTNSEKALAGEEPLYAIPKDVAQRNNTLYQVHPSLPSKYTHKVSRPRYIDTHQSPYAVFIFKYRNKDFIEQLLNTSIVEPEDDEKQRLSSLSKDELVEQLILSRSQNGSLGISASRRSSDKATFASNPHGIPIVPNLNTLTDKLNKLESSKAPTPEKVGGWLDDANANENGSGGNKWMGSIDGKADRSDGNGSQRGTSKGKRHDNNGGESWNFNNTTNDKNDDTAGGDTWYNNDDQNDDKASEDGNNNGTWRTTGFDGGNTSWGQDENQDVDNGDTNGGGETSWSNNEGSGEPQW